ncbi:MAG TPA: CHAT domain-containing tetratricopeptide repeat protein [Blastocatellia bacterium]|nr:CHAT domain-containing tetratricopeptide repeat protein [Blastocatellia bacterium]
MRQTTFGSLVKPLFLICLCCSILLVSIRPLSAQDRPSTGLTKEEFEKFAGRLEAVMKEATELVRQGKAESLPTALKQLESTGNPACDPNDKNYLYCSLVKVIYLVDIASKLGAAGEHAKALECLSLALSTASITEVVEIEATIHNIMANTYGDAGEFQKSLEAYHRALSLRRTIKDQAGEAKTLNNMGLVYDKLGQVGIALEFYNLALPLRRAAKDQAGEASTLNNIATIYSQLGEFKRALEFLNQALPLRRATGDKAGEASTLQNLGIIYGRLGNKEKALDFCNQALSVARAAGDRESEASALNGIGLVYSRMGQRQNALKFYTEALTLRRAIGDRLGESLSAGNLAWLMYKSKQYSEALAYLKQATAALEFVRSNVKDLSLRTSLVSARFHDIAFIQDVLLRLHQQQPEAGYDRQALQASESARARVLVELLTEAQADIRRGVDSKLLEEEDRLIEMRDVITKRLSRDRELTKESEELLKRERADLERRLQQTQAQIRHTSPVYASLTQPRPLTVDEIQNRVLDDDTLLLQYRFGSENTCLFAVTRKSFAVFELPDRMRIVELAVRSYLSLAYGPAASATKPASKRGVKVKRDPDSFNKIAAKLSRALLAPAAKMFDKKRIVIVADGILNYVPFAALPDPNTPAGQPAMPLLVNHEIVNLPSVLALDVQRRSWINRPTPEKQIAIFADPVFEADDDRLTGKAKTIDQDYGRKPLEAVPNLRLEEFHRAKREVRDGDGKLNRLDGTRLEAEAIMKLFEKEDSLLLLDFAANRSAATSSELSKYRYLHFATHALFNNEEPSRSGLVLSMFDEQGQQQDDGYLRTQDLFNLNWPAELVVLSACQTGLGQSIRGEGSVGLTRGLMYAGVKRVVVSLWNIDDQATAELMSRFYRSIVQENRTPAEALRIAQLSMLNNKDLPTGKKWSNPEYWAAFVFQGEWH